MIKIILKSGKEIELTKDELKELLDLGSRTDIQYPESSEKPIYPQWPAYSGETPFYFKNYNIHNIFIK